MFGLWSRPIMPSNSNDVESPPFLPMPSHFPPFSTSGRIDPSLPAPFNIPRSDALPFYLQSPLNPLFRPAFGFFHPASLSKNLQQEEPERKKPKFESGLDLTTSGTERETEDEKTEVESERRSTSGNSDQVSERGVSPDTSGVANVSGEYSSDFLCVFHQKREC